MALINLPPAFVRSQQRLPFALYDARGQLLLGAGKPLGAGVTDRLGNGQPVFADANEAAPWKDAILATVQRLARRAPPASGLPGPVRLAGVTVPAAEMLVDGSSGSPTINARTVLDRMPAPASQRRGSLSEQGQALMSALSAALRDSPFGDPTWLERALAALADGLDLARREPDGAFFLLLQHCGHSYQAYSAHHGLLCAVLCQRTATLLGWPAGEIDIVTRAAITMNIGMGALQDQLAHQHGPLRADQRRAVDDHPQVSVGLLEAAGVTDRLWLEVVARHHQDDLAAQAGSDTAARLAHLLQLVDRYTAKMSRRKGRQPMSSLAAARHTCVPAGGQPDAVGAALLKSVGLYPPGSYVRLASGETGVVLASGARADRPRVAVLVGASGLPLQDPVLRDTSQPGREVTAPLTAGAVKVQHHPDRLLGLQAAIRSA